MGLKRAIGLFTIGFTIFLLSGCASLKPTSDPVDPYEAYNRHIFRFNTQLDNGVIKPVAKAYTKIFPAPIRKGVRNFFGNLNDVNAIANDLLQGNIYWALSDTWRVIFNTTIGIFGIFDVASKLGLRKHDQSFGLTLAKWGIRKSYYTVVPFFGPSTLRDFFAYFPDLYMSPWPYIRPFATRNALYAVYLIDLRSQLLPADKFIEQSFDPYIFVRSAYLQRRQKQIEAVVNAKPFGPDIASESSKPPAPTEETGAPPPPPAEDSGAPPPPPEEEIKNPSQPTAKNKPNEKAAKTDPTTLHDPLPEPRRTEKLPEPFTAKKNSPGVIL